MPILPPWRAADNGVRGSILVRDPILVKEDRSMMVTDGRASALPASRTRFVGALPLLGVAVLTALVVAPAFAHAVEVWATTEEFSFGFLVPVVSAVVIWWRREALRKSVGPGAAWGLPVVLLSAGLYLLAYCVGINALAGLAVIPLLWGIVVYLWGWGAGRVLAFPIGFLAFGLGLYRGLLDSVGFAMQGVTAVGAATLAQVIGLSVGRDGLVLRVDQYVFIVAEACSGMSSLLSLLALAALWIYVARGPLPARLAVVASVLPLVLVANTTRVTAVLWVASQFGQEAAVGFFHGASSLLLFGMALSGLLVISRMVGCRAFTTAASS
jgi:exosortase